MAATLLAVVLDCRDAFAQATWWATVLGHDVSERNTGEYEVSRPSSGRTPLYFMTVPEPKTVKDRLHLDLTVDEPLDDGVARLVAIGATVLDRRRTRRRSRIPTPGPCCRTRRATSSASSPPNRSRAWSEWLRPARDAGSAPRASRTGRDRRALSGDRDPRGLRGRRLRPG